MKLHNRCGNNLSHVIVEKGKNITYFIANGDFGEVPKKVAEIWLKIPGVTEYVEPADLEKAEAEAKAKQEAMEKENAELKKKLEALEKAKTEAKK
ncbi:TPA: hypothetical protein CPT95_03585 [Candidatus Gastranaerophilales bacterium HUM_15]|jgi:hypothetical protein|nr:MAG TPA: hypothetical protein CPT95_03585 [Candidatus Gastranaerophilales bacterium HUM_15]